MFNNRKTYNLEIFCISIVFIGCMYTFSVYIPALFELKNMEQQTSSIITPVNILTPKVKTNLVHLTVSHKKNTLPVKHKNNHGNFVGGYMYAKEQE